jgi:hypothetical protein
MRKLCLLLALAALVAGCSDSTSPSAAVDPALAVDPPTGTVITDFMLTASSRNAGSRALEYRWDFESDGTYDTGWSSESVTYHRYASGDTITVTVEARDGGDTGTASATLVLRTDHGTIVDQMTLPPLAEQTSYAGITNDGHDFWVSTWRGDIYKLSATTCAKIDSIDGLTNWTGGLDYDGEHLWVYENQFVHERDPATGERPSYFAACYSAFVGGVAWDGQRFYVGSDKAGAGDGDGLIHVHSADGAETGTIPTPGGSDSPRGLACDGENLWVVIEGGDTLYCVNPDDGSVRRTVAFDTGHGDLTVRDGYLWTFTSGSPRQLTKVVP